MKISRNQLRTCMLGSAVCVTLFLLVSLATHNLRAADSSSGNMVPLTLQLPSPAFNGTPKDSPLSSYVEPLSDKPRPYMMVPAGLKNVAPGSKITSSDKNATAEALAKLTDGDKEASEESIIYLRKGTQWVQLDF